MKSQIEKIKRALIYMLSPSLVRRLISTATTGYLWETGWIQSVRAKAVVDATGKPIPWATFPYLAFVTPRLKTEWRVFEYGAGASTLFYSGYVDHVTAVEHDVDFANALGQLTPKNVSLICPGAPAEEYINAIDRSGSRFDLIVVDGIYRNECIEKAISKVTEFGVVVLDDAERNDYAHGVHLLHDAGFKELPFWGLAAGVIGQKCTCVYYRKNNVLGL
jgi:hypothetical protein